jgi:hypothetical protein
MRKLNPYALRVTAVTAAAAFALMPMAAASAATANASAFGAEVTLLGGGVHVGPLAVSTQPPGGDSAVVPLHVIGIADVLGIYSTTSGTPNAGTSAAEAGTADVNLIGTAVTGYAISANAISATCTANGTSTSGSATVANLAIGGNSVLNLTNVPQQNVITLPGIASVIIGEQIPHNDGSLTVNALHITLLGSQLGDIVSVASPAAPTCRSQRSRPSRSRTCR